MNKNQLVEQIAKDNEITKRQANDVLENVLHTIVNSVKKGEDVRLVGFGTFCRANRKARVGINPKTKQKMNIPSKNVPKFRPSSEFKKGM